MEDLIGKRLKYKGTNDIKIVKDVKNNRVYFTDNGSVDLNKLNENFEEIFTPKPNTDTFFEPEMNSNFGNLISQIEQFKNDPSAFAQQNQRDVNEEPITKVNGQDASGLSPETIQWMKQQEIEQKQRMQNKEQAVKQDPWMAQFGDTGGEVKRYDSNSQEELERVQKINNGELPAENMTTTNTTSNTMNIPVANQTGLPKMKKTFKIKLKFELNELIPKVEDIRAVENLFEVSLTESIAKEIADKYLNDRELFEGMIIAELDKIIKPKKKKPVAKKPIAKKTTKKNEA
jgi:hypothetical protein